MHITVKCIAWSVYMKSLHRCVIIQRPICPDVNLSDMQLESQGRSYKFMEV